MKLLEIFSLKKIFLLIVAIISIVVIAIFFNTYIFNSRASNAKVRVTMAQSTIHNRRIAIGITLQPDPGNKISAADLVFESNDFNYIYPDNDNNLSINPPGFFTNTVILASDTRTDRTKQLKRLTLVAKKHTSVLTEGIVTITLYFDVRDTSNGKSFGIAKGSSLVVGPNNTPFAFHDSSNTNIIINTSATYKPAGVENRLPRQQITLPPTRPKINFKTILPASYRAKAFINDVSVEANCESGNYITTATLIRYGDRMHQTKDAIQIDTKGQLSSLCSIKIHLDDGSEQTYLNIRLKENTNLDCIGRFSKVPVDCGDFQKL